jgi:hypothetical protein
MLAAWGSFPLTHALEIKGHASLNDEAEDAAVLGGWVFSLPLQDKTEGGRVARGKVDQFGTIQFTFISVQCFGLLALHRGGILLDAIHTSFRAS